LPDFAQNVFSLLYPASMRLAAPSTSQRRRTPNTNSASPRAQTVPTELKLIPALYTLPGGVQVCLTSSFQRIAGLSVPEISALAILVRMSSNAVTAAAVS